MRMEMISQILSSTSSTPKFWPANTVYQQIFRAANQIRPHEVIVASVTWRSLRQSGRRTSKPSRRALKDE